MFLVHLGRMSDRQLVSLREDLLRQFYQSTGDDMAALDDEIAEIDEELSGRAHDLENPSSGLGCHQPT